MLLADPELIEQAARKLLGKHFPPSLHDSIRDAVRLARPVEQGLQPKAPTTRDRSFRHAVLRAYERRCVVCGFDVRLNDELVALEAAHIRWHSHGGPDQVRNGLALCILHHQTFDRGAIGLERATKGYRLVVSDEANGQSPAFHQLLDCHGKRIRNPQSARQRPDPNFVDWHRKQVFRGTPRDLENP
ncbi:MAG: HNH endonuclease [Acidobacteria bacterium]|nr:HNH endonuclease [Acidobacteriota bacterium]